MCLGWATKKSNWRDWEAETHLELPADSPHLFFLREGTLLGGIFKLTTKDEVSDKIDVDVTLVSRHEGVIDDTQICFLNREGGGDGVGIIVRSFTFSIVFLTVSFLD